MSESFTIESISINDLQERVVSSDFDILRLDHKFDIKSIQERVLKALSIHPPAPKDGYSDYLGIGLQYSNPNDPIYDVVQQLQFISPSGEISRHRNMDNFSQQNEIGRQFPELFNYLQPLIRPSRTRILVAKPGFRMSPHQDGAQCATLHLAVQTSPEVTMIIDDREYHIPSDGYLYALNVSRTHSVLNNSMMDRNHITVPLTPFSFRYWTPELAFRLQPYAKMYGYDLEKMTRYILTLDPLSDQIIKSESQH